MKNSNPVHRLFVLMVGITCMAGSSFAINTPWLHTDGKYLKDPSGNTVVLRGVDLPDIAMFNTSRGTMNVSKMIDLVSDASQGWYARIIRLCISPGTWNNNPDGYYNTHLKPAVDHCVQKGVYCIVDWHYIADPAANDNSTKSFWTYVAPKFKTCSNVFYEVYNENSSTSMTWDQWKSGYAQPWFDLIRQYAPDNVVLVGGPMWAQRIGGSATNPVSGTNIVYVGHIYPGIGASVWSDNGEITNAAKVHPVIISEWGYQNGAPNPCSGTQSGFGDPFKTWVEKYGVSWTAWCADDSWDPNMFDNGWNLLSGANEMGGFTRDWLNAKKSSDLPGGQTGIRRDDGVRRTPNHQGLGIMPGDRRLLSRESLIDAQGKRVKGVALSTPKLYVVRCRDGGIANR